VKAPVEEVRVEPLLDEYSVGDVINCSANGWPAPSITWHHMSGPQAAGASDGQVLNVVEEMRDEINVWKCVAMNSFGTKEQLISFNVSRKSKQSSRLIKAFNQHRMVATATLVHFC